MLVLEEAIKADLYFITFHDDPNTYMRSSSDNWRVLMGESWEPVYDCEELENAFFSQHDKVEIIYEKSKKY